MGFLSIYKHAAHIERLPRERTGPEYRKMRLQVMLSIFLGYAGYYLVRNNFSLAKPYLINDYGFTKGDVGLIATGLSIAYGLSKFVMGNVSDRSNPRYFMATGLIASGLVNLLFPAFSGSLALMFVLWFVNGWAQGMGWAPCARTLTHWFSDRERGTMFATWNLAHNVGGGLVGPAVNWALALAGFLALGASLGKGLTFHVIFYAPALIAIAAGLAILVFLRDTPQSCGLPSIEDHKDDHPDTGVDDPERELGAKEIFVNFVLNNKALWLIAIANVFVYVVRYGVLDWAPTYLTAVKACPADTARWQFFVYEIAGIPGTLLAGWASDRWFGGRRGPVSFLYMALVTVFVWIYWQNPPGRFLVDSLALFAIGFLIYGPVMLIGVSAVDLVPKKAAGTAAGFTGFFGYMFGAVIAEVGVGRVVDRWGWDGGFALLLAACVIATAIFATTWKTHHKMAG
ncbi:MAG: glycerol-3-phosphate transporter [Elusimicrobia bacterium RIFOXYB2_FULL_62_6]|nr:MAG: glycerol-3-phosphate transporter [Elusimicrobia bacterium RIFOXYB2_FULL_62_6]